MQIRSASLAGLALVLSVPAPHQAPASTRFRIDTKSETLIDLSAVGQPSNQNNFETANWIAVTLSDSADGQTLHVVVDSMRYLGGTIPQLSQATADSTKGGIVHGFIDRNGRVRNLSATPEGNLLLTDLQGVLNGLFPRVKIGARMGDTWSDTLETINTSSGANVKSNFVIDYSVAGLETAAGISTLRVNSISNATVTGTMPNPMAGTMQVQGTIKGTSTFSVTSDGRFLGGTSRSSADQSITIAQVPTAIPVKVQRTVRVTVVP